MKASGSAVVMVMALVLSPVGLAGCSRSSTDPDRSTAAADPGQSQSQSPSSSPDQSPEDDGGPISFEEFPLDRGWEEIYGANAVVGPGRGAGGISMPEGHCNEGVLFESGYQDKLSTYVTDQAGSRTREVLRYANAKAARRAFRSLIDAVASCPTSYDAYTGRAAYSAEVYDAIDGANGQIGIRTLTFAYTSIRSAPFGVLYQFALIDDLVYGSNDYGKWTRKSADDGVAAMDHDNDSLVPLLSRVAR